MAIILRGKRRGEEVEIHQFANDWISLKEGGVINPTSLGLNMWELKMLEDTDRTHLGMFWGLFEVVMMPESDVPVQYIWKLRKRRRSNAV